MFECAAVEAQNEDLAGLGVGDLRGVGRELRTHFGCLGLGETTKGDAGGGDEIEIAAVGEDDLLAVFGEVIASEAAARGDVVLAVRIVFDLALVERVFEVFQRKHKMWACLAQLIWEGVVPQT